MISVFTPERVESVEILQVLQQEVRGERREGDLPPGLSAAGDAVEHRSVLVADQAEPALAQRDHGVELRVEGQGAGVAAYERGARGRLARWRCRRTAGNVEPDDLDSALRASA